MSARHQPRHPAELLSAPLALSLPWADCLPPTPPPPPDTPALRSSPPDFGAFLPGQDWLLAPPVLKHRLLPRGATQSCPRPAAEKGEERQGGTPAPAALRARTAPLAAPIASHRGAALPCGRGLGLGCERQALPAPRGLAEPASHCLERDRPWPISAPLTDGAPRAIAWVAEPDEGDAASEREARGGGDGGAAPLAPAAVFSRRRVSVRADDGPFAEPCLRRWWRETKEPSVRVGGGGQPRRGGVGASRS